MGRWWAKKGWWNACTPVACPVPICGCVMMQPPAASCPIFMPSTVNLLGSNRTTEAELLWQQHLVVSVGRDIAGQACARGSRAPSGDELRYIRRLRVSET
jgi:hypothetical protein